MTMTASQAPPGKSSPGGVSVLRTTIIACLTQGEGAAIMCADCGYVFAAGKPFTDESEGIDNVSLSKALYYHMCAIGRRPDRSKAK